MKVTPHKNFKGIYCITHDNRKVELATLNLSPGTNFFDEHLFQYDRKEFRVWDPYRSKLSASILKGLNFVPIQPKHKVLYLGAASGTTASYVSDIVGSEGHVYCIDFAPEPVRNLILKVCAFRKNISPILADARFPEHYRMFVETVDDIYCDVAQTEQARILADNADMFLKDRGWIMQAIKARSINSLRAPSQIYKLEAETLKKRGFALNEIVDLCPYDKDHVMIVARFFGRDIG